MAAWAAETCSHASFNRSLISSYVLSWTAVVSRRKQMYTFIWFNLHSAFCKSSSVLSIITLSSKSNSVDSCWFVDFIKNGENFIPKHVCPEATASSPTAGLTSLWDCIPFRTNSNYRQISQEEARQILFVPCIFLHSIRELYFMIYVLLYFIMWLCWLMCWRFNRVCRDRTHCNQRH
jgi:hypothetical protein